jgi:hypothetical protein
VHRTDLSDLEPLWAFSPQAKWVVAACDELIIWDVETHKVLARLEQARAEFHDAYRNIRSASPVVRLTSAKDPRRCSRRPLRKSWASRSTG